MKAIYWNPTTKELKLVQVNGLKDKQKILDDLIEGIGYLKPNGALGDLNDDFVYGAENAGYDEDNDFTYIKSFGGAYVGPLLIVGSDGKGGETDVKMTIGQAAEMLIPVSKESIAASRN